MKKLIAILSIVLFANQASAFGGTTCSAFSKKNILDNNLEDKTFAIIYEAWLDGFKDGANFIKTRQGEDQVDSLTFMLKQYCRENPLETLSGASAEVYRQLENN